MKSGRWRGESFPVFPLFVVNRKRSRRQWKLNFGERVTEKHKRGGDDKTCSLSFALSVCHVLRRFSPGSITFFRENNLRESLTAQFWFLLACFGSAQLFLFTRSGVFSLITLGFARYIAYYCAIKRSIEAPDTFRLINRARISSYSAKISFSFFLSRTQQKNCLAANGRKAPKKALRNGKSTSDGRKRCRETEH